MAAADIDDITAQFPQHRHQIGPDLSFSTYDNRFHLMSLPAPMAVSCKPYRPQHFLYFLPLPQGQGSFLPIFGPLITVPEIFCAL